jgi:integrase
LKTVTDTATSAFIFAPKAGPKFDFGQRRGRQNLWSNTKPQKIKLLQSTERELRRWICVKYFAECADYLQLDDRTKRVRRGILEGTFDEPTKPGAAKLYRDFPLSKMTREAVEVLRDRKIGFPEAANSRVKAIRAVFKWAITRKGEDAKPLVATNPARDVAYLKGNNPLGFHTWTEDEIRQFEERHPVGTKARLALALLVFTGQRRSDIIRFGRQHVRNGEITFTQFKGRKRKPKTLVLPILPVLQQIIEATQCGELTFLMNELGRPFTDAGFGNKFREWCDQAGLHHCAAHGIRKAAATRAADNGATSNQLMAMFGWTTLAMAEKYTKAANQKRLAAKGMYLIERKNELDQK